MRLSRRLFSLAVGLVLLVACDAGRSTPEATTIRPAPPPPMILTPTISAPASTAPFVRPSPTPEPDAATFTQLAARPLRLPILAPGASCPRTPGAQLAINLGPVLGDGPIYADIGSAEGKVNYDPSRVEADGTIPRKTLWVSAPSYHAPSLIRGQQIDGSHTMQFFNEEEGLRGSALRFPTETGVTSGGIPLDWRLQPSLTYIPGPGCYAYQVDGLSFSYDLVIEVQSDRAVSTRSP